MLNEEFLKYTFALVAYELFNDPPQQLGFKPIMSNDRMIVKWKGYCKNRNSISCNCLF
jgi:hypothetical protein